MFPRLRRPRVLVLGLALCLGAGGAAWYALPSHDDEPGPVTIRVDQGGYVGGESKAAYLMGPKGRLAGTRFEVVDEAGRAVLEGAPGPSTGAWNATYDAVRPLDISALTKAGTYRLHVTGTAEATSPRFTVAPAGDLMKNLAADNVRFFQRSATAPTSSPAYSGAGRPTSRTVRRPCTPRPGTTTTAPS